MQRQQLKWVRFPVAGDTYFRWHSFVHAGEKAGLQTKKFSPCEGSDLRSHKDNFPVFSRCWEDYLEDMREHLCTQTAEKNANKLSHIQVQGWRQ
ncbi:hypothetical protein AVEN_49709-1 [Araneus ventricosus]|uniref:Uncharacterized protein n=1 Tax=Araneus ventricosus TaxID=182803 RepID=A0A4Y2WEG1_ARAVE|nr:hypothetical protein AVEN_49709-1 [Araneus ventricosus]